MNLTPVDNFKIPITTKKKTKQKKTQTPKKQAKKDNNEWLKRKRKKRFGIWLSLCYQFLQIIDNDDINSTMKLFDKKFDPTVQWTILL